MNTLKITRKTISILLVFITMISLASCNSAAHNAIYDDNNRIASMDSYNAVMFKGNANGNQYTLSSTLTGVRTIWKYNASENADIAFSFALNVPSGGKAKLVLITPEDEVITLVENISNGVNEEMHTETISLPKGENTIKIVGYDEAKIELRLSTDAGKFGE